MKEELYNLGKTAIDYEEIKIKILDKGKISISLEDNYDEFERNDLGLGDYIVAI